MVPGPKDLRVRAISQPHLLTGRYQLSSWQAGYLLHLKRSEWRKRGVLSAMASTITDSNTDHCDPEQWSLT